MNLPFKIYLRLDQPTGVAILKLDLSRQPRAAWRAHLREGWRKRRYWYFREGTRKAGRLRVADLVVVWRLGTPAEMLKLKGGPDGEL